jgi:hypothetical protein
MIYQSQKSNIPIIIEFYVKKFSGHRISSYKSPNIFLEFLISDFGISFICTFNGFSLIGYVPNTLYINSHEL